MKKRHRVPSEALTGETRGKFTILQIVVLTYRALVEQEADTEGGMGERKEIAQGRGENNATTLGRTHKTHGIYGKGSQKMERP